MFIVADYEHCRPGETKDVANSNELKIINEKNYNFSLTQPRNKKCARDDHEKVEEAILTHKKVS